MEPAQRNQREREQERDGRDDERRNLPGPGPEQTAHAGVARLVVAGIGGAGCNAVNRMIEAGVQGVEFLALNTDAQALDLSRAPQRLQLGEWLTRGLGAGGNPELGRRAAEESDAAIREALEGADMVFVTAGMGGGTGTGAAPLVAQAARELGALAIAVVTTPFAFERRRKLVAQRGLASVREVVDALIVVPNERLMELAERDLGIFEAYRRADDVLRQGVQGISDLVTIPGLINLDFADVRTVMADAGSALIASGRASGENRAEVATRQALTNPLLDVDISGAGGVIFNVTGGEDLTLREVETIASLITEAAHPDANIIYGTVYDPAAAGTLAVAVVATGFEPRVRHERGAAQRATASQTPHAMPMPPVMPTEAEGTNAFAAPSPANTPAGEQSLPGLPHEEPEHDLDRAGSFSVTPIEPYVRSAHNASPNGAHDAADGHDGRPPRDRPMRAAPTAGPSRTKMPGYHGDEFVTGDESEPSEPPQEPHRRWEIFGRRS